MSDSNILDKSMRSVFVGNIPYEATEEKLKDIFNEAGPVLSFKLVYDRETGKPKGYGFCEYKDQETALSAMRNLNGYEIGGRSLRVDNACTEKSRLEIQSLLAGPPVDNTYGEPVDSDKAPEEISKAVASLPPEQMFELMKQMKMCIQNNPEEGKQMLLQNPQLAYALLQAQVVMRIVDPQVALTMLHKVSPAVPPLSVPATETPRMAPPVPLAQQQSSVPVMPPARMDQGLVSDWLANPSVAPRVPTHTQVSNPLVQPAVPPYIGQDMDMRSVDPRARPLVGDQDLRIPSIAPPPPSLNPAFMAEHGSRDPRYQRDPRTAGTAAAAEVSRGLPPATVPLRNPTAPVQQPPRPPQQVFNANIPSGASDQEKAALIMQVLQLSDEQIAMLPPEQRQSILVLKEQIAKSTQR